MSESPTFISSLFQIFTWIIIIIGWYVVHYFTLKRENRKEARERIDVFLKSLHDIEVKAISFHRHNEFKEDIAFDLKYEIQRAISRLNRQPFCKFTINPRLLTAFRQAVTFRNFEPRDFSCQESASRILSDIASAVDDIEEQIEKEYERIYL